MAWTLRPGQAGGARVPSTGASSVRGHGAIGRTVSADVTPLMPPVLAFKSNPIHPWDASFTWHRAFTPQSLTQRSNKPQLDALGMAPRSMATSTMATGMDTNGFANYIMAGSSEADSPGPGESASPRSIMTPAVTQSGALRFVARRIEDDHALSGTMSDVGSPRGLGQLKGQMDHGVPNYLYTTKRLPVPSEPRGDSPLPGGTPLRESPRRLTPAHLLRNGLDDTTGYARSQVFSPRRFGSNSTWQTMNMEFNERAFGARAYL